MTQSQSSETDFLDRTTEIVAAYVGQNSVPMNELPNLIRSVHDTLAGLTGTSAPTPEVAELKPSVPVKKSVTQDAIICLEDGKPFKSLKRHLMTAYGMTPDEYRTKWGLPSTYPMVAPAYAAARSNLARTMGLGRKPAAERAPATDAEPETAPVRKRPGRKPKVAQEAAE